jgi:hypothetical protein
MRSRRGWTSRPRPRLSCPIQARSACSPPADFETTLELLGVDDQPLEPLALLGLARFVNSVANRRGSVRANRRPIRGCAR